MSPDTWLEWLADFRKRLIAAKGWSEKKAKRCLRDGRAVVRKGRVHVLTESDQRPSDAMPVFEMRTPGGWMLPIEIVDQLTGVIGKAMVSQRSPRDIVLGLLSQIEHANDPDESDETRQKRDKACFWIYQLLNACEDKALAGVIDSDVFWQTILYALEAGRWLTILELYRDPQLLDDLTKAQAFQSGRSPDELTRCLEARFLELRKRGRPPRPREVAKAAGGEWSERDACWQFGDQLISHDALCQRLKDIRHKRPA